MNKRHLATAAAASTLGGAVAGAALLGPGLAGAQDEAPTEATAAPEVGDRLAEVLQGLVDDGTITDTQRDAVVDTLIDAGRDVVGRHGGGRLFTGGAGLAEILGLEPDELRDEIVAGRSLADIAAEQGVDTQELVDAIVAATEERVAAAVEAGRLDEERADEIVAEAPERAEDVIEREFDPEDRPERRFRGRFGHGPDRADGSGDSGTEADPDA